MTCVERLILFSDEQITKKWLKEQYWDNKKSLKEMAEKTTVSYQTIYRLMKKWDIPRRSTSEANKVKIQANPLSHAQKDSLRRLGKNNKIHILKKTLVRLYFDENKTTTEIAKICCCSSVTVISRMKEFGLKIRSASERKSGPRNPSWGKKGSSSPRWGKAHTEQTKKILSKKNSGKNSVRWKPPHERKETLARQIRATNQSKNWRLKIFKRDKFSCVECGTVRTAKMQINADHIKPFALILEDNNVKSVEEALTCQELWDTSNGRTLCVDCHKKTNTWGSGTKKLLQNKGRS